MPICSMICLILLGLRLRAASESKEARLKGSLSLGASPVPPPSAAEPTLALLASVFGGDLLPFARTLWGEDVNGDGYKPACVHGGSVYRTLVLC